VSTLDSEDLEPDLVNQDNDIELSTFEPSSVQLAKSGLQIFCTEIPPPRMLKEAGYVDVVTSQAQKHVIVQTFHQEQQKTATKSPPNSLVLSGGTVHSEEAKSSLEQTSSQATPVNISIGSNTSNPSSIVSAHSVVSSHSLEHNTSTLPPTRDVTLSTYNSPHLSPLEPQPMTMPDAEDPPIPTPNTEFAPAPMSYFYLALCATILCCVPVGVAAMFKALQVRRHYSGGDLGSAVFASRQAKRWSIIAIVTGSVVWTLITVTIIVVLVIKLLAT
jgi:hypothetical protein